MATGDGAQCSHQPPATAAGALHGYSWRDEVNQRDAAVQPLPAGLVFSQPPQRSERLECHILS